MTKTVDLDVAQATLGELIANLKPDDDVVIMQNHKPTAKLVATSTTGNGAVSGDGCIRLNTEASRSFVLGRDHVIETGRHASIGR